MKTMMLGMVVALSVLAVGCVRAEEETGVVQAEARVEEKLWLTDFDQALKVAAEKKLPVLVDFTGSDWCGWCIRLDKEVFSQDAFKAYAKEHLVLLKLDFPRKKLPKEQAEKNQALSERFKIRGFPTIVLVDADGREKARTGYKAGGAEAYVAHLKALLK